MIAHKSSLSGLRCWTLLGLLFIVAALPPAAKAQPAGASDSSQADGESPYHHLAVWLGFSHWFGATFGSPDGFQTPCVGIGFHPFLRALEIRLRYSLAVAAQTMPSGSKSHVGFASLEVVGTHGLSFGRQRIELFGGLFGSLVHADGFAGGFGLTLGSSWTFALGGANSPSLGPFFEVREVFYKLPSDADSLLEHSRRDAQIDLGLVIKFF